MENKVVVRLKDWQYFRLLILSMIFLGTFGVLIRLLFFPKLQQTSNINPASFSFPSRIPLNDWQFLSSHPIDDATFTEEGRDSLLAAQAYEYIQRDRHVKIETFYTIETNGRAVRFLDRYTSLPPSITQSLREVEQYHDGVGYYLLFEFQQNAYLTSCINSRGESTVTLEQFQQNRYFNDIRLERLLQWLVSSESIRDFRCLWVHLSTPLHEGDSEEAFLILENVWFEWNALWRSQFPKY